MNALNQPVKNCMVFTDNKKQNISTNSKGFYYLSLKTKPKKIMFSSLQHGIAEVTYLNHRYLNITFKKEGAKIDINNYSDEVLTEENPSRFRYTDIYGYLRGVPGVQILPGPGKEILIRGVTSLNGSSEPLYVLNNMAISKANLNDINPNDIKKVKVVKGANATAYGIRGSAGVIEITTF